MQVTVIAVPHTIEQQFLLSSEQLLQQFSLLECLDEYEE